MTPRPVQHAAAMLQRAVGVPARIEVTGDGWEVSHRAPGVCARILFSSSARHMASELTIQGIAVPFPQPGPEVRVALLDPATYLAGVEADSTLHEAPISACSLTLPGSGVYHLRALSGHGDLTTGLIGSVRVLQARHDGAVIRLFYRQQGQYIRRPFYLQSGGQDITAAAGSQSSAVRTYLKVKAMTGESSRDAVMAGHWPASSSPRGRVHSRRRRGDEEVPHHDGKEKPMMTATFQHYMQVLGARPELRGRRIDDGTLQYSCPRCHYRVTVTVDFDSLNPITGLSPSCGCPAPSMPSSRPYRQMEHC